MNKKSHLIVTRKCNTMIPRSYSNYVAAGCILPDLLLHTYLTGHTWDTSGKRVLHKLERFGDGEIMGKLSYLTFGMMLHYIEDFFTMAHSSYFTGNLISHIKYESGLGMHLKQINIDQYLQNDDLLQILMIHSAKDLTCYITQLQHDYQSEIQKTISDERACYEIDLRYMSMAVNAVLAYFIPLMNEKTVLYQRLVGEVIQSMPQGDLMM